MNSAFIFPNSTPISSESGHGGGNGGKFFKGTLKLVSFTTQGFSRSLIMNPAFIFLKLPPLFLRRVGMGVVKGVIFFRYL